MPTYTPLFSGRLYLPWGNVKASEATQEDLKKIYEAGFTQFVNQEEDAESQPLTDTTDPEEGTGFGECL